MRFWIGLALLAVSWLWGLALFQPAQVLLWIAAIAAGTLLLAGAPIRWPRRGEGLLAAGLLLPAVWLFPWPDRMAPLLAAIGLVLRAAPIPRRWRDPLGRGAVAAGWILLAQSVALGGYIAMTARCHELPGPLAQWLATAAWLSGADVAANGSTVAIGALRGPIRLGATWELLVDPATLAFLAGGLVFVGFAAWNREGWRVRAAAWTRSASALLAAVVGWLLVRAGLVVAFLVHRVARWDPAEKFNPMGLFFSPWVHLVLLVPPLLLAWHWVRVSKAMAGEATAPETSGRPTLRPYLAALACAFASWALWAWIWQWDPVGSRLEGRVMVVERHSTWEPTTRPYDPTLYGEASSYTYAVIYDYCSRCYRMSRLLESDPINDDKLQTCDVLVVKMPTSAYTEEEIEAIERFVQRGGGLLLIGEHTDVFKTSTHLNAIARRFGFRFSMDLLFSIGDPYVQWYDRPTVPHPIVQHLPHMNFAVSCSIDPGRSLGRAAVRSTGLWSLPPDYHIENFFPEAEHRPDIRFGAFVQLWTTRYGRGRVAAWTDSTIFSNFSIFEPGKTELFLGMLEWLNRRSALDAALPRTLVFGLIGLVGIGCLAGGVFWGKRGQASLTVLLAASLCGAVAGSVAVAAAHAAAMPLPEPARPFVRVVIDRTVSDVPLSRGGFTRDDGTGYGLLEQWIPRLGYFTARRSGSAAFEGDVLVVICPQKSVSEEFRQAVVDYVAEGGKLLVIDSPDVTGSTANSLLWPFGLGMSHATSRKGKLTLTTGWPGIQVPGACEVTGGEAFMWVDGLKVAARTPYGEGRVMAVGFGSAMNDESLGSHWMAEPTPEMLAHSNLLFALVQALVEDRPVRPFSPPIANEGEEPASASADNN